MSSEFNEVSAKLDHKKTITIDHLKFTSGFYHKKKIILVGSGIGKVNAAAMTALLISQFHPVDVFNVGIAGTLQSNLHPGDVVISSRLYQVEHVVVDQPASGDDLNPQTSLPNSEFLSINPDLLKKAQVIFKNNSSVFFGTIVTTDVFPSVDYTRSLSIKAGGMASDMEGYAVCATAHLFHVPCVVIRGISDDLNQSSDPKVFWQQYYKNKKTANEAAVRALFDLIKDS